jgi:redox-sensing transcriptional repressor
LRDILSLNAHWNVAVVGVGRLGRAIISYPGFTPDGFHLVAAFDANPNLVGQRVGDLTIHSMSNLEDVVSSQDISIAILAVPAMQAQEVIDRLVESGIRAILNYAPTSPQVPNGVRIRNIDPVIALQSMTYYLGDPAG